mgnify:CR=1 FL=1
MSEANKIKKVFKGKSFHYSQLLLNNPRKIVIESKITDVTGDDKGPLEESKEP